MINKKVRNARVTIIDGIPFKSRLEARVYELLKAQGIKFSYQPEKAVLMHGFKPHTIFLVKTKNGFDIDDSKVRDITYTPDFTISHNQYTIYVETKGFKTDAYNIKVKLFRKWLEGKDNVIFAEVKTLKELKELLTYIQEL